MAKNSSEDPVRSGPRSSRQANRCQQCGANIREAGLHCPRCGALTGGGLAPATPAPTFKERWLPVILIALVTFVAYIPSLDNGFVSWDDDHYIYKNQQVHYDDGLQSIWFDVLKHEDPKFQGEGRTEDRVSHQYYPLVFSLYWLEFHMYKWFGHADPEVTIEENIEQGKMDASLFHLDSVLLHMVNVMLLIFCFRQLGASNWVAWAATLLFALHPMQASSVAWAAERKNIISLMFYLLSMMAYIKLRRDERPWAQKWWRYALSLVLFQAALFSKTVALTLPVMLFFTDRLLERRWDARLVWNSIVRIAPFVILSCIAAYTTMRVEDRQRTIPISDTQRPLLPAAVLLWYPYKMLWAFNQSPVYSLWPVDARNFLWFLPTLAVIALGVLIVLYRRKLGPLCIWAVLFYCVTQGPMLGLKNINYFQFAYVADHYFYHGAVGLMLLLALGIAWVGSRFKDPLRGKYVATGLVGALALVWGVRTFTYVDVWTNAETFWAHILERHPDCWPGWYNTANARRRDAVEIQNRLNKADQTDEERADLRKQAADLRAEAMNPKLSGLARRHKIQDAYRLEDQSKWPNLSPQEQKELAAKREALFDDAVERYKKVRDIHHQITQPYDQWITVRQIQQDWAGAYTAAIEAARRFPGLTKYFDMAGQFAKKAQKYPECYEAMAAAARGYRQHGRSTQGLTCETTAAVCAEQAGMSKEAIELFLKLGKYYEKQAETAAQSNPCAAVKQYKEAATYYNQVFKLDRSRDDMRSQAVDMAKRSLTQEEICKQGK